MLQVIQDRLIKIPLYVIAVLSLGVFLSNNAFADNITTKVNVAPSLKITLPTNTLNVVLDPSNNDFDSEDITVSVATNHRKGYKLYLNTATGSGGSTGTNLVNTVDNTKYIETLPDSGSTDCSSGCSESTFPVNRWGYRISAGDPNTGSTGDSSITDLTGTNYYPFVSNKLISSSEVATNGVNATLDFASKVDYSTAAGKYNIAMNFQAIPIVANHYMQEFATDATLSAEVCTTNPAIIIDQRDESAYMIQRLADGKCWMLDNLNLDLTDRTIAEGLTSGNTNAPDTALNYLRNGGGGGTGLENYATTGLEYHNWTGSGMTPVSPNLSYTQPLVNRSGICDSTKNSSYPCVGKWQDASYTTGTVLDTADAANNKYDYGPGSYKIGTYYNYCAASAGSYCYDENGGIGDATSDICPAGWHMPSSDGGNNGDYLTLCSAIVGGDGCNGMAWNDMTATDPTSMQYQLSTPLSGHYLNGTAYWQGTYGRFWSSSYRKSDTMRRLRVSSSGVFPQGNYGRAYGSSVRCVSS